MTEFNEFVETDPTSFLPKLEPPPVLDAIQQQVIDAVNAKKNVFFTGCAGTGKSLVLREIIRKSVAGKTYVTASTGMAAVNIGGMTIHSFAGIRNGDGKSVDLVSMAMGGKSRDNWLSCERLIIDEISMIDARIFDVLDLCARAVRARCEPFGGIQVIICGDFLQLPPVVKDGSKSYCFQSEAWAGIDCCFELKHVYRQADADFVQFLSELRQGICTANTERKLRDRIGRSITGIADGIEPTRLYPLRKEVDGENMEKLRQLDGELKEYNVNDYPGNRNVPDYLLDSQLPPGKSVSLKVRAQVILLKNLSTEQGLVNGSRGVVTGFDHYGSPIVQFASGTVRPIGVEEFTIKTGNKQEFTVRQIPLKLAWALSIHKCQGMTLDAATLSLRNVFECGQAYVALSRVRSLAGLVLEDFNPKAIKADQTVVRYYQGFSSIKNREIRERPPLGMEPKEFFMKRGLPEVMALRMDERCKQVAAGMTVSDVARSHDAPQGVAIGMQGGGAYGGNSTMSDYAGGRRGTGSNRPVPSSVVCYRCKEAGHFANKCPNPPPPSRAAFGSGAGYTNPNTASIERPLVAAASVPRAPHVNAMPTTPAYSAGAAVSYAPTRFTPAARVSSPTLADITRETDAEMKRKATLYCYKCNASSDHSDDACPGLSNLMTPIQSSEVLRARTPTAAPAPPMAQPQPSFTTASSMSSDRGVKRKANDDPSPPKKKKAPPPKVPPPRGQPSVADMFKQKQF